MAFGKLGTIAHVHFALPADPPDNACVLSAIPTQGADALNVYVGCTGWGMKEWVGSIYPPKTQAKDYLKHYARQFNTIEHNTTHYRIPDAATVQKWYADAAPDFRFCPKIPQTISHSRDLGLSGTQIAQFCDAIELLQEKLGACFLQLPPYFGPDRLGQLDAFLQQFPRSIPLAVELRHEDWFNQEDNRQRLFELLERRHTGAVITDVAGRRDVLHGRVTSYFAMVRFVGNDLHPTDFTRLEDWAERILHWQSMGLKEIWFFTHEPDNLRAPEAAAFLVSLLQDKKGIRIRGPKLNGLPEEQEGQLSLF